MPSARAPIAPRFEHLAGPVLALATPAPRLSWVVPEADPGWTQRAYEIQIVRGDGPARTFEVAGAEQVLVPWPDEPLSPGERVDVRVRVRDDAWTEWSAAAHAEAAPSWHARFISPQPQGPSSQPPQEPSSQQSQSPNPQPPQDPSSQPPQGPAPVLRGELTLPGPVRSARLHITAHGLYRAAINGRRVGDHELSPGWTSYGHRLRFHTHDVTELLGPGANTVDVVLGNGWFRGRLGFAGGRALYGDRLALLAQLDVVTADGQRHRLATDGSWRSGESNIDADDLYDGQRTDLRRPAVPAVFPGGVDVLDDSDASLDRLVAPDGPPVRVTEVRPAIDIITVRAANASATVSPASDTTTVRAASASTGDRSASDVATVRAANVSTRDRSASDIATVGSSGGGSAVNAVDPEGRTGGDAPPEVRAVIGDGGGGRAIVDFGQNVVGWVRLRVRGRAAGSEVVVRHAEVLEDGELGVRPLRTARNTDTYVLGGPDEQVLEPCFTFHGFRYAEITGAGEVAPGDVEAVVVGSDLRRTGWFETDHELLGRFHENVVQSMRGNFVDVPTDCPQRDERLGWTGDIQVFAPAASFLFDSAGFLTSWLADLAADQQQDGSVPFVVPDVLRQPGPAAAAWGDAATVVPSVVHERTGDLGLLARQFPSMRAWADRIAGLAGPDGEWAGGFQFGDWLDPTAPPDNPFRAATDPDVVATAHLVRSADLVAAAARLLGDPAAADRYAALAARARAAFAAEYVTAHGRVLGDAPTGYALALAWDLLPTVEQRDRAARRLADLVRSSGFRIATGFVGTPLIADALTGSGHAGVAYRLLLQTGCPSWLYPVTMGATTVWERWDSMLPDGSINPGEMTSFNHYALGAVADWLHRTVAGLAPASPGYRTFRVRPEPAPGLTRARARHLTPYGEAEVAWQRRAGRFELRVRVPVGSTATVHVPGGEPVTVAHGLHTFEADDPVREPGELPGGATVRDVLDAEPVWRAVVVAAVAAGAAADEPGTAARLARCLDAPASDLAHALTAGGFVPGAEALRHRLADLLPGN